MAWLLFIVPHILVSHRIVSHYITSHSKLAPLKVGMVLIDRLSEFGQAKSLAIQEGTAFERADALEKGKPPGTTAEANLPSMEEQAMNMPAFYTQCEEVIRNNKSVEELTDVLDKFHKQALSAASQDESADLSAKINITTGKLNKHSNDNRRILQSMDAENRQLQEVAPKGSGHMRMREAKHRQLATSFMTATQRLQKLQQYYKEKHRQNLERQIKIVNPKATSEDIARITSDEAGAQAQIFASAVREDAKKTLAQMKDRFEDVKLIEKNLLELHQLFLDLQTMVVQQGDIINRVDHNVGRIDEYNESAAQDLKLAVDYQKSIWKKKWIILTLILIGVVILILILLYLLRPIFQLAAARSIYSP